MEERTLICLNNGNGTIIDIKTGKMSNLDLTLVSASLVNRCEWTIIENSMGSDHYPVYCTIDVRIRQCKHKW